MVRALPYGDKLGHLILWGVLAVFVDLALGGRAVRFSGRALPLNVVGLVVVVTIEELSQGFLANRTLDAGDMAANLVGIGLGTALARYIARRRWPTTNNLIVRERERPAPPTR